MRFVCRFCKSDISNPKQGCDCESARSRFVCTPK